MISTSGTSVVGVFLTLLWFHSCFLSIEIQLLLPAPSFQFFLLPLHSSKSLFAASRQKPLGAKSSSLLEMPWHSWNKNKTLKCAFVQALTVFTAAFRLYESVKHSPVFRCLGQFMCSPFYKNSVFEIRHPSQRKFRQDQSIHVKSFSPNELTFF